MAAITKTQVTLYPVAQGSAERYAGGVAPREVVKRRLALSGVSAGDVASADVLGLSTVLEVSNAITAANAVSTAAVNPVTNEVVLGAGPANTTVYLTVTGVTKTKP
jgi:ABC-type arginine/histidine transport system permease subunit